MNQDLLNQVEKRENILEARIIDTVIDELRKNQLQLLIDDIKIETIYNLVKYDRDMGRLYTDLKNYLQEKFGDDPIVFKPNERLVFVHEDLDFLIDPQSIPFTLYNLQLILKNLNISNVFCRIITNRPNYQTYTRRVQQALVNDVPIPVVDSCLYFTHVCYMNQSPIGQVDINIETIQKPFTVLSRLSRSHRTYFMSQIFNSGLHHKGIVTYHNLKAGLDGVKVFNTKSTDTSMDPCSFLYTVPFSRISPEHVIVNEHNQHVYNTFKNRITRYSNIDESVDITDKTKIIETFKNDIIQQGLIYVALETMCNNDLPFISRILTKSIVMKRPFIILGCPGSLAFLKSLGFKTFSNFWSEEYDNDISLEDKTEKIINILNIWSNKSLEEIHQALESMADIVEYNFNHFTTTFCQEQTQRLIKGLR